MTVHITMRNGEKVAVDGYESSISEQINAARTPDGTNAPLLRLETPRIPRGQMVAIDPNEVMKVIGDGW